MTIIISMTVAFVLSGISQVTKDLGGRTIDRPMWTTRPTLGKAALVAATWFTRPIIENIYSTGQKARGIAFGTLAVLVQFALITGLIWCCIAASTSIFDNLFLQIITTSILVIVAALFVMPLVTIVMMPVMLILALPLELFFPLRSK